MKNHCEVGPQLDINLQRDFLLLVQFGERSFGDLSEHGLINVEDWPEERLAGHGVTAFARVEPEALGIRRKE